MEECVDNGGIAAIWCWTCKHLAFRALAGQEFGMFRKLWIYSLYLKAEGKHVFLAACRSSFFSAHGKLLELMGGALARTSLEPNDLG